MLDFANFRVAVVEPVGGHGGMNFYNAALCKSIIKAGVKATLFTCDKTAVDGSEGFPVQRPYRGIYGKSPAWWRGLRFFWGSLKALPGARLSGHKLAHLHFFHVGPLQLLNVLLARLVGLRVVITAHDVEPFKHGLSNPLFVRWAYRCADRVIVHSQVAKDELIQEYGIADRQLDVILHGNYVKDVPAELSPAVAKRHFGLSPQQRVLLFFGQIKDVKGLDVLLAAFALARKSDTSLHLLIGGRVWKGNFSRYQDIIDHHGLRAHCSLHIRYIPDAEVPLFYRCADLVVLPYLRIYQSGVVLQAMSYGRPVLVSNIAGMLEAIEDGCTGFVFKSSDPEHLAQRITDIFAIPGQAEGIAMAGHRMVKVRNDWGRLGEQVVVCYQRAWEPSA